MSLNDSQEANPSPSNNYLIRIIAVSSATTVALMGLIAGTLLLLTHPKTPASPNPFTLKKPSESFPIYYSTQPPIGYVADPKSVTQPHDGVLLFNLLKGNDKIVVTEEARTDKMVNLGAFYQSLKDSKQVVVSDGSIATGYFGTTKVASRANNHTWVIATTTANVSLDDLRTMMEHLTNAP